MLFHSTKPGSNLKQCRDMLRIARHPAQTARTRIPGSKTACRSPGAISCNSKGSDFPTPLRAMTCHWTRSKNLLQKATRVSRVTRHHSNKILKNEKNSCFLVSNRTFFRVWQVEYTMRAPGWTRRLQGWRTVCMWNLRFCMIRLYIVSAGVCASARACAHTNIIKHVRNSSIIVQPCSTH